jgi:hypothetical protein
MSHMSPGPRPAIEWPRCIESFPLELLARTDPGATSSTRAAASGPPTGEEMRILRLLAACGPQPAVDLETASPSAPLRVASRRRRLVEHQEAQTWAHRPPTTRG